MTRKEEIITDASFYSLASILTQGITLVAGILTRHFLGPLQMGIWSLLQVILVYSSYLTLGVHEAVSREIPFYYGKGDHARADEIKNLIFSFSTLMAVVLAAGVLSYAVWRRAGLGREYFYGLLFVSGLVILQRVNNLYIAFLRGYKHFSLAAKQMVWSSVVNAVLVAILSWRYRFYGFMWAMALSFLFNIVYIVCHQRFRFQWKMDLGKITELIRYGFPLMLVGLLSTVFLTIDKLMIAKMIGVRELGLYSVATLSYTYIGNIPTAIGIVLIPNLHQKYGETQNSADLRGYLTKSAQVFSDLMPVMIAVGWLLVPFFVRAVLSDFEGSIEPMRALILSGYFLALLHPYSYFLAVVRKQMWLLPILLVACLLAFVCNLATIRQGWGIVGVGIATTVVLFVKFTTTYVLACRQIFTRREYLKNYAVYLFKFLFMVAILFALRRLWPTAERSLAQTIGQCLIFGVLYAPFLWKLNKDLGVFATLKKKFMDRLMPEDNIREHELWLKKFCAHWDPLP